MIDLFPSVPQIDSEVCPQRILISKLPKMDAENLLNKLEIHFSKKKHGGGEVERCELMPDSWTVVLTFVDKDGKCAYGGTWLEGAGVGGAQAATKTNFEST